jgi:hypothetical protein
MTRTSIPWRRLCGVILATALSNAVASAANIAWVSFHPADNMPSAAAATAGFTEAPDKGYTDLLAANGHTVSRFVTHDSPTPADLATLNAADLVIVGRSVASGHYQQADETLFWNTAITKPLIHMGGYAIRANRAGLYSGSTIPDTAGSVNLTVNNPGHPIFAGIALDGTNTTVNPYANLVTVPFAPTPVQRGISVVTDPIVAGGQVLATIGTAGDPAFGGAAVALFPPGTLTAAATAPTPLGGFRLIFLSGSRESTGLTSEGSGVFDLSADGSQLFLNAVDFMVAIPEPSSLALCGILAIGLVRRRR